MRWISPVSPGVIRSGAHPTRSLSTHGKPVSGEGLVRDEAPRFAPAREHEAIGGSVGAAELGLVEESRPGRPDAEPLRLLAAPRLERARAPTTSRLAPWRSRAIARIRSSGRFLSSSLPTKRDPVPGVETQGRSRRRSATRRLVGRRGSSKERVVYAVGRAPDPRSRHAEALEVRAGAAADAQYPSKHRSRSHVFAAQSERRQPDGALPRWVSPR